MSTRGIHNLSLILFVGLASLLIVYIALSNYAPFGIFKIYVSGKDKEVSELGPKERVAVQNGDSEKAWKVLNDLVYFSTSMPFHFDTAKVKVTFQNSSPDQLVYLGFQDLETWHYDTQLVDAPLIEDLGWSSVGGGPQLLQREKVFESLTSFLQTPPSDAAVGIFNLDSDTLRSTILGDYVASGKETFINVPLRGRHVMYAYLQNEPFEMTVSKQDLNWYEDEDVVDIKIYKENTLVYQASIADDGITDTSQRVLAPQEITMKNPGPGLPESGVYKIVIDASGDTVIKSIRTNLHKIVFEGFMFPVGNHDAYPKIAPKTEPVRLFTDAKAVSAVTYHKAGFQEIKVGSSSGVIKLAEVNKEEATGSSGLVEVQVPKGDVIVKALPGYFALSQDSFFKPMPFNTIPITKKEDLDRVDYVITNYKPTKADGDWRVSEIEFDLSTAVVKNGKLSWLIKVPGLKDNGRDFVIKKIEVEFSKKPLIKI